MQLLIANASCIINEAVSEWYSFPCISPAFNILDGKNEIAHNRLMIIIFLGLNVWQNGVLSLFNICSQRNVDLIFMIALAMREHVSSIETINLMAAINWHTPRLIDMSYISLVIDTAPVSPRAKLQVHR